jgi:hypothetical protein
MSSLVVLICCARGSPAKMLCFLPALDLRKDARI